MLTPCNNWTIIVWGDEFAGPENDGPGHIKGCKQRQCLNESNEYSYVEVTLSRVQLSASTPECGDSANLVFM